MDYGLFGYCPQCGAPGVQRENRGMTTYDRCKNGHNYPATAAVYVPKLVALPDQVVQLRADLAALRAELTAIRAELGEQRALATPRTPGRTYNA